MNIHNKEVNKELIEEQKIICQLCYGLEECPMLDECLKETEKWIEQRRRYERAKI